MPFTIKTKMNRYKQMTFKHFLLSVGMSYVIEIILK